MAEPITTTFKGLLFDPGTRRRQLDRVIKKSLGEGVNLVKSQTPVITGYLKSAWQNDSESIYNFSEYALFVEEGTRHFNGRFMMRDSLPEIEAIIDKYIAEIMI